MLNLTLRLQTHHQNPGTTLLRNYNVNTSFYKHVLCHPANNKARIKKLFVCRHPNNPVLNHPNLKISSIFVNTKKRLSI